MTPLLRKLRETLQSLTSGPWHSYTVPGLWVGAREPVTFPSAAAYLLHQLSVIDALERKHRHRRWNINRALVYNGSVRHITAYHHGKGVETDGWRQTGTFLKLIGLLPYLADLGVDTLVLMPITEIGDVGKKGTLGSPYAVKHPLHIDKNLAEPVVPHTVEDQARMAVEACHALGIKVILETVLRTASIDSHLVEQNPEWFYWVDEDRVRSTGSPFIAPSFSDEQLAEMKEKVQARQLVKLPEPSQEYQELFSHHPVRIRKTADGWVGDGPKNKVLRIPGAFADWPADDPQPAWTDVTYLRLHDHPHYRYMAYNTVRMYEKGLDTTEYRSMRLWNTISAIIPFYVRTLNIDGAMIDMGHALPRSLRKAVINNARNAKSDFLLFEENFNIEAESAHSGYDAAIGYLPFDSHSPKKLAEFIDKVAANDIPIRYFATPESHNTPRAAMRAESADSVANVWLLLQLLPKGIGFIHAGIELGEHTPVNTGLQFTDEEIQNYPPEKLPLFSNIPLCWNDGVAVHSKFKQLQLLKRTTATYRQMTDDDVVLPIAGVDSVVGFFRFVKGTRNGVVVVHSTSQSESVALVPAQQSIVFVATQEGVTFNEGKISITLASRETRIIPFLAATNA